MGGPDGGVEAASSVTCSATGSGGVVDSSTASWTSSLSAAGFSRTPMSPKAPPSMLSSCAFSASSRAISADVFDFTMVAPISPTWRGLNSGCVPEGLKLPAWCRGYHAGLSFLRPGFNSRSGRHLYSSSPWSGGVFFLIDRAGKRYHISGKSRSESRFLPI